MTRNTSTREKVSKLDPITKDEFDALGQELYDMGRGIRKYEVAYDLRDEDGTKVDGNLYVDKNGHTITLDSEIDKDEGMRIETYVHEIMHGLRDITDKQDEWIVEDYLTPKALIALYGHKNSKVREMAEKGFKAWEKRQKTKFQGMYVPDDDGIREEFGEYFQTSFRLVYRDR